MERAGAATTAGLGTETPAAGAEAEQADAEEMDAAGPDVWSEPVATAAAAAAAATPGAVAMPNGEGLYDLSPHFEALHSGEHDWYVLWRNEGDPVEGLARYIGQHLQAADDWSVGL